MTGDGHDDAVAGPPKRGRGRPKGSGVRRPPPDQGGQPAPHDALDRPRPPLAPGDRYDPAKYQLTDADYGSHKDAASRRALIRASEMMRPSVMKIEWARGRRGMAIAELEQHLDLPGGAWSKFLSGEARVCPPEAIPRAMRLLGISAEFMEYPGDWGQLPEDRRLEVSGPMVVAAGKSLRDRGIGEADEAREVIDLGVACKRIGVGWLDLITLAGLAQRAGGMGRFLEMAEAILAADEGGGVRVIGGTSGISEIGRIGAEWAEDQGGVSGGRGRLHR